MLCPNCFRDKLRAARCSACAFDEVATPQMEKCLPYRHELQDGAYVLGRILGKPGGFGTAYKGWDVGLGAGVVVKEFHGNQLDKVSRAAGESRLAVDPVYERDFQRGLAFFRAEARLMHLFKGNRNIVSVLNAFDENNTHYYVMPYVNGGDLQQARKRLGGRLPQAQVIAMAHDLLDALEAVHAEGYVHCDIKASNILLQGPIQGGADSTLEGPLATTTAVLIDFGGARKKRGDERHSHSTQNAPPELLDEKTVRLTDATDIFPLCATLHQCLVGKRPPDAETRARADVDPYRPIAGQMPDIDRGLANLIDQGLSLSARNRPQSARDARSFLPPRNGPAPRLEPDPDDDPSSIKTEVDREAQHEKAPSAADRIAIVMLVPAALAFLYALLARQDFLSNLVGFPLVTMVVSLASSVAWRQRKKAAREAPTRTAVELILNSAGTPALTRKLLANERVVIGRKPPPEPLGLRVVNRKLSSQHVSISVLADGRYHLLDLDSTNHVFAQEAGSDAPPALWPQVSSSIGSEGRFMLGRHDAGGVLLEIRQVLLPS